MKKWNKVKVVLIHSKVLDTNIKDCLNCVKSGYMKDFTVKKYKKDYYQINYSILSSLELINGNLYLKNK